MHVLCGNRSNEVQLMCRWSACTARENEPLQPSEASKVPGVWSASGRTITYNQSDHRHLSGKLVHTERTWV